MLISLRATLLVLFIAAPFGEHRTAADLRQPADDFAADAVLTCPLKARPTVDGVPSEVDTWTAGKERTFAPGAA